MRGAIYYYSGSGNTEASCKFIAEKLEQIDFELLNVIRCKNIDLKNYDIIGFAFSTQYLGVPEVFRNFIESLESQQAKPVFLLNTYGMMQGKALKLVNNLLVKKGFRVIAWHALMTPENYPPFIAKGWTSKDQPDEKQMAAFKHYILDLSSKIDDLEKGADLKVSKVKIGLLNSLIGVKSREKILKDMGHLKVTPSLCNKCGRCAGDCHYNAIRMEGTPVFDTDKCRGCWSCFNHCPQKAIYTDKVDASNQYKGLEIRLS